MKNNTLLRKSIFKAFQFLLLSQRSMKDLSQKEFSRKSGLSRQYISLIECGRRMPSLDLIFNIADGFEINIKDFMPALIEKILYYENLYDDGQYKDGKNVISMITSLWKCK